MSYTYVDPPNSNLICCICRTAFNDPVTTRTCSHTFCRDCITRALSHSSLCPIDRSLLVAEDLSSANPIIQSMVNELLVECVNAAAGCQYKCQRQLLVPHLRDSCPYAQVSCPHLACEEKMTRKDSIRHECASRLTSKCDECGMEVNDPESHYSECAPQPTTCTYCTQPVFPYELPTHHTKCLEIPVSCPQARNGCHWKGPRRLLPVLHEKQCAYVAVKGFFNLNDQNMTMLTEENLVLKHRVEALEGLVSVLQVELRAIKQVLGPWFLRDYDSESPRGPELSTDFPTQSQLDTASAINPRSVSDHRAAAIAQLEGTQNGSLPDSDTLAQYFPSQTGVLGASQDVSEPYSASPARRAMHRHSIATAGIKNWEQFVTTNPSRSPHPPTHIPPLDTNGTVFHTLTGLRNSVVSVAGSLDLLGRQNEVTFTNESMRLNEEMMSLRATVHGLRLQLHAIMIDRNTLSGGRLGETLSPDAGWPSFVSRFPFPPPTSTQSITKL